MDVSEIKTEVEDSRDIKVKLEENSSSVVYDTEITFRVDIKPKEEDTSQSSHTPVTIEEISSVIFITKPYQTLSSDDLKFEPGSKISSNGESEIDSEDDSNQELPQHIRPRSPRRSIRSNQNVSKRKKIAVKMQNRDLLQCTLCPQSFPTTALLITHVRNHHAKIRNPSSVHISDDKDEVSLQCPLCSKSLASVDSLTRHFLTFHIKNKPFQCSICLASTNEIKKFPTEAILKNHIKQTHDPRRYKFQCVICSLKFPSSSHYKRHKRTHIEKQYKCEYCSNAYREKESMLRHIIAVHNEYTDRHETFKCDECEQLFCSKKDLEKHVLQTHDLDPLQCKICFKKFREEGKLNMHLKVSHRENRTWLVCDVCSKAFNNNKDLVHHLEVEHKRFFKCRKCFKSFVSKEDYKNHSAQALVEEGRNGKKLELQCNICRVFLKTECAFTTHKDTHLNPSENKRMIISNLDPTNPQDCLMKCDFCPKTFVEKSLLLDHARKCHPNRKLKCKSCEKSFQVKFQLNKHELLHSTKKLLECQVCYKGFANLKFLKQHEGIHKIEKRFKCSQCEKSFAAKFNLKVHIVHHHGGKKPFKCDICKKAFVSKSLLKEHSAVHTKEKPFSCSKCSYSSKWVKNLTKHQERVHSENSLMEYKKLTSHPVRLGPHLKFFENLMFVCCLEKCDFETKNEKEVAIHYAKHNLPKVILPRLLDGPSGQVFLSKCAPMNGPAIQARYKCTQCFKYRKSSRSLRNHWKAFHNERNPKRKKKIYVETCSDEDEM